MASNCPARRYPQATAAGEVAWPDARAAVGGAGAPHASSDSSGSSSSTGSASSAKEVASSTGAEGAIDGSRKAHTREQGERRFYAHQADKLRLGLSANNGLCPELLPNGCPAINSQGAVRNLQAGPGKLRVRQEPGEEALLAIKPSRSLFLVRLKNDVHLSISFLCFPFNLCAFMLPSLVPVGPVVLATFMARSA